MISQANLRKNTIANFIGKGWSLIVNLAFIPIYIQFLGVESYGLVGVYASMTVLLSVLDLGLSITLNREMAKLSAESDRGQDLRDTVRTFETTYWVIGIIIGIGIVLVSPWISEQWLSGKNLPTSTIYEAIALMGILMAFQWPTSLYTGGLLGLQRQVLLNGLLISFGTARALGSVIALALVGPTIQVFFIWQVVVTAALAFVLRQVIWRVLPLGESPPSFRKQLLINNWRFSSGMILISILVAILTQMDKIVLSRRLSLEDFGFYSLAASIGVGLNFLVAPIFTTLFPRMTQLVSGKKQNELRRLYHQGCQLVAVSVIPVSAVVVFFAPEILAIWLRNPVMVQNTHLVLSILALGTMLNSLVNLPYGLQLAYGWTRLSVYKNVIAVILLVPLMSLLITWMGAAGAALAWVLLNLGYVLIEVPIMHTRLLRNEQRNWYLRDVGIPLMTSFSIVVISRWVYPIITSLLVSFFWISLTFLLALLLSALVMPETRKWTYIVASEIAGVLRKSLARAFGTRYS